MKKLFLTWAVLRLIWESKGYSMKEMPGLLSAQWTGREGFAFTSIQRKAHKGKKAPSDVANFVMDDEKLPVREGHEKTAEVVRLGLLALRGQPTPNRKPPELALDLLAHFPTDELALKLADALAKQAGLSSGTGSLFDVFARAIADRLPRVPKLRTAKLARLMALHLTNQLDRLSVKRLAVAGAAGGAVACVVGLLFVAVSGHSRPAHAPEAVPQQVIIVTNMAPGGAPLGFDVRAFLGAVTGQMGQKVVDQYIPDRPLPNQKLPPCLGEAGESDMNGGCWAAMADVKPPCGRYLFRGGDKCYRPVAADPSKRVGEEPRPGQGAPTGEQPRPMQEMPEKEGH